MIEREITDDFVTPKSTLMNVHPIHSGYPLFPGDGLIKDVDGTYTKVFEGIQISGFVIDDSKLTNFREWAEKQNEL